jgi:hypothetical protein
MISPIKLVTVLFAALALFAATLHAAALDLALPSTVNAANYAAGATAVKTIRILSIDYAAGVVRFQLLTAGGTAYGNGAVYGLTDPAITEANAQSKITAAISI